MERRINYVVVGLFVVILGGMLLGIILWLGSDRYGARYERYYVFVSESVSGLTIGSDVTYMGVDVGRIADIRLKPGDPRQVQLLLELRPRTPVDKQTVAQLQFLLLTGVASVELYAGRPDGPGVHREPGLEYPVIPSVPSMFIRIQNSLLSLGSSLQGVGEGLEGLVSKENQERITQVLADLQQLSSALAAHKGDVERTLGNLSQTSALAVATVQELNRTLPGILSQIDVIVSQVGAGTPELMENLGKTGQALRQASGQIEQVADNANRLLVVGRQGVQRFSTQNLGEISALVAELRRLTTNLNRFAAELERRPSALIQGRGQQPPGPGE